MEGAWNQAEEDTVIIVAGCPKSGKSKALNNLFHTDFDSCSSAVVKTRKIEAKRVINNGHTLIIVDTPGFGATDLPITQVRKYFKDCISGLTYTVLFCHCVGPNSADHKLSMKNLQKALGKEVWERCIFLFTFSDRLRSEQCQSNDEYVRILQDHALKLSHTLKHDCGRDGLEVRLVQDVGEDENVGCNEIVAVPVGADFKLGKEKHELILRRGMSEDWRIRALLEIVRKSNPLMQLQLLSWMHGKAAVAKALEEETLGILLGGIGEALVGLIADGIGAIPAALTHRNAQKAKQIATKMSRLKEAELVVDPEQPMEDSELQFRSLPISIRNPPKDEHPGEIPSTSTPTDQPANTILPRSYDSKEDPENEST